MGLKGGDGEEEKEGEEGGEISPMCESIGHRPFGAAAQKGTDRATDKAGCRVA